MAIIEVMIHGGEADESVRRKLQAGGNVDDMHVTQMNKLNVHACDQVLGTSTLLKAESNTYSDRILFHSP